MLRPLSRSPPRSSPFYVLVRASRIQYAPRASTLVARRFESGQSSVNASDGAIAENPGSLADFPIQLVDLVRNNLLDLHAYLELPWIWVIPIAAACVRLALFFPVTKPARKALQRRLALTTIIDSEKKLMLQECRTAYVERNTSRKGHGQAPLPAKQIERDYAKKLKDYRKGLEHRHKAGLVNTMLRPALIQSGVFVLMGSAIRDLGGMKRNILLSFFIKDQSRDDDTISNLEPSMLTEGPSWAADLTVADPTGLLPASVAIIMTTATVLSARAQRVDGRDSAPTKVLNGLSLVVVLGMTPFIWGAPAGLLYYWACSSSMAVIVNLYLDRRYPLKRVAACKRPLIWMPPAEPDRWTR